MAPAMEFEKRGVDRKDWADREQFFNDFMGVTILEKSVDDQLDPFIATFRSDLEDLGKFHCVEGAGRKDDSPSGCDDPRWWVNFDM
jgi:hypothetical protein